MVQVHVWVMDRNALVQIIDDNNHTIKLKYTQIYIRELTRKQIWGKKSVQIGTSPAIQCSIFHKAF